MVLTRSEEVTMLEYLATMRTLIYSEQCREVVAQITGKDIVIFIGNTRAGKSTIVNHVIGNQLRAVKYKKNNFKIVNDSESAYGPVIGAEATSETTIPSIWTSGRMRGLVVDAPGFDDNRGEAQDVANAFYIREMIVNANSVKFVLITDVNDIVNDNIAQFISFVEKIHTMLPQCESLLRGMLVVFNKDKEETSKTEIVEYLTSKIILQEKIKMKNRALVRCLIDNPNQFVICPAPGQEGPCEKIFEAIDEAVEKEICVLEKHLLRGVTPGISDKSLCFLLEAHNYLTEFKELDDILQHIEKEFTSNFIESNSRSETRDLEILNALKKTVIEKEEQLSALLESQTTVKETLLALGKYVPSVEGLQDGDDVFMKIDFVKFVDEILRIEESNMFQTKITAALSRMKNKLTMCRIDLQEKLFEISNEEAQKKFTELLERHKQDKIEYFEKLHEMQQKQIEMLDSLKKKRGCVIQ